MDYWALDLQAFDLKVNDKTIKCPKVFTYLGQKPNEFHAKAALFYFGVILRRSQL